MRSIENIIRRICAKLFNEWMNVKTYLRIRYGRGKCIYLFGCPIHSNIGDQAQLYCISNMLRDRFPNHDLLMLNWRCSGKRTLTLIRKIIAPEDHIFFHSGYFMVEHHSELSVYRNVVDLFHDKPIVIFPQTIHFSDSSVEEQTARSFNAHPNLTLMCRDQISYASAQKVFNGCKLLLYPDVVTSLIGCRSYDHKREGILFCMRNDPEAYYKPHQIQKLMDNLGKNHSVILSDTTIHISRFALEHKRKEIVEEMIESFSKYKLVITDRYHGTIFSLIANTPVIVLASADHKLSSGVKWFPDSFFSKIRFANDSSEAVALADKMISFGKSSDSLPSYFMDKFYSDIWSRLEG